MFKILADDERSNALEMSLKKDFKIQEASSKIQEYIAQKRGAFLQKYFKDKLK
jgi:hypothetical protein